MQKKEQNIKIDLDELVPQEAKLKLSNGKELTLGAYTLRVQIWASKTFGRDILEDAMRSRDADVLSQLAYYVLKEKDQFPTLDSFLEVFVSFKDRSALLAAILETVGLSQPVLEKLAKQLEGNEPSPGEEPTGAASTTLSPASTPGVPPSDSST